MEHGIYTLDEPTDDYAARWDRMALPYDEAMSQEEQQLYRGPCDHQTVPLPAFLIAVVVCVVLLALVL